MADQFKWGIIGPGRIAHKFAEAVHKLDNSAVYAIASRSTKQPEELKRSFAADFCYDDYAALAEDKQVDAVYVATPHRFHYENVKICLEAGKAVLCEKSFTVNAAQAQELFTLSRQKNIFLMEALWTRFLPIYVPVLQWIDEGEIGDVRHVYSTLGFVAERNTADRLLNIDLAGGTVLDLGVYTNAITQWVFRKNPEAIHAFGHIGETGVDETINVSYRYPGGATAQFACTFEFAPRNQLVIHGSDGRIIVETSFVNGTEATLEKGKMNKKTKKPIKINGFEYQIIAAMDAIREGRLDCPQMPQADTLANMQTLDEIRKQIGMRYPFE
jgi:predicted dehydrogenase